MLPRTSSAIPIVAPGSRTNTPTKRPSTPPPSGPTSPPESPTALRSLGVHAPVFVPRFSTPQTEDGGRDTPQSNVTDDPFAASYQQHVAYEPAYTPYYAPLLPPYALEPLDFHNYHPAVPGSAPGRDYFMAPNLRDELQRKQEAVQHAPYGHPTPALPDEVHVYHSLAPLEPTSGQGFFGGFTTSVYRAVNRNDGASYVLYRIENCRLPHDSALSAIEAWSSMPHPSIVRPHEAFTTRAFNDQSLVVVYDYHPLARTLQSNHLSPSTPPPQTSHTSPTKQRNFSPSRHNTGSPTSHYSLSPSNSFGSPGYNLPQTFSNYSIQNQGLPHSISQTLSQSSSYQFSPQPQFSPQSQFAQPPTSFSQQHGTQPVDERLLWTYLLQLASAVRIAHSHGLAVRCLDSRKVLITGVGRVRINAVGIIDIMSYDGQGVSEPIHMQEDLLALGSLLLQLTSSASAPQSPRSSAAGALNRFSPLLRQAVLWLITPGVKTIDHLWKEISPEIISAEMNTMLEHADSLEHELSRELENGRLVRLLCKFGFINERPEFDHDPRWAETGDRYIIKLFRDHVFHQLDTRGKPVLNLTHVFTNLNKLDAGSDERLMLVSRDERNCLVVSYKEIKTCIESAYRDLSK